MEDPILREIWEIKERLSAQHGHDLRKIYAEILRKQANSGREIVNLRKKDRNGKGQGDFLKKSR
jgi:hypothetical protein